MNNSPIRVTEFRLKLFPKDFAVVRKFYEQTMGFKVLHEWDNPGSQGVMFDVYGTVLELLTPQKGYKPVQGVNVSWGVPDVWKLWEEMKHGTNIVHELRDNSWGDTSFAIADPEGFEISLFTKRPD